VVTLASHDSLPSSPIPSCLLGFTYFCQAVRRKAALCFSIHAAEAIPTLDSWLKETLLTGLLPIFSNIETEAD